MLKGLDIKLHRYCSVMFIVALYTIAMECKQPRDPTTNKQETKTCSMYTMEYYPAVQNNKIMKQIECKKIILSGVFGFKKRSVACLNLLEVLSPFNIFKVKIYVNILSTIYITCTEYFKCVVISEHNLFFVPPIGNCISIIGLSLQETPSLGNLFGNFKGNELRGEDVLPCV